MSIETPIATTVASGMVEPEAGKRCQSLYYHYWQRLAEAGFKRYQVLTMSSWYRSFRPQAKRYHEDILSAWYLLCHGRNKRFRCGHFSTTATLTPIAEVAR